MKPTDITVSAMQKAVFREQMKEVYTSIPGHIVTFNPSTQRAQVQIGIQRVLSNGATQTPQIIQDVPVHFAGGDYVLEFEIRSGTEGMIFFSQRCIDGWKNSGGVAFNPLARFFDVQDCYFVPGIRSLPNVITNFQNNGIRIRDKSGTAHVWVKNDGTITADNGAGFVRVESNGTVNINGVTFKPNGDVAMPSNLAVSGGMTNGGVNVGSTHRHSGVQTGSGNTGTPIA